MLDLHSHHIISSKGVCLMGTVTIILILLALSSYNNYKDVDKINIKKTATQLKQRFLKNTYVSIKIFAYNVSNNQHPLDLVTPH